MNPFEFWVAAARDNRDIFPDLSTLDGRIDSYESAVTEWMIEPARVLLAEEDVDGGFAVLQILMGYFEGYWVHRTGQSSRNRS